MIVDVYTHVWESPDQLGRNAMPSRARAALLRGVADCDAHESPGHQIESAATPGHQAACERADRVIVVAFKSLLLEAEVPNRYVADYAREHPEKLIGFAGIDPAIPEEALADIAEARDLGLRGAAIAPAAQGFHPASSGAYKIYESLVVAGMPLIIHQGLYMSAQHRLEYARPVLLDEVARDFPALRIIIAHLGEPWMGETMVLLAKHPNLYAEISGVLTQPWLAYTSLLTAYQSGVLDKLLFASGFPMSSTERALESLYRINRIRQGTSLPSIPRDQLRGIVERPSLELLGLPDPGRPSQDRSPAAMMVADPDA